jgi:arabinogalactan endo-1,4-beta-galactosidase
MEPRVLSRRRLLSTLSLLATTAVIGSSDTGPIADLPQGHAAPVLRGADLSSTLLEETAGRIYYDQGQQAPVERLLAARGANVVRLRVWVDPPAGVSDLASALVLARRAHEVGLAILLDLHYSSTWADTTHQSPPSAWAGQNLTTLTETVRRYTRDTVQAFALQGTPLALIQIGNEVTNGMLWPLGQIYDNVGNESWDGFAALLAAGIQGANDGASGPLRTLVHIDRSCDNGGARYFYDHIIDAVPWFDVLALSYYPFWNGSITALRDNLVDLAPRYQKDVLLVETAYPWTLPSPGAPVCYVTSADQLPDATLFPATPTGQASYYGAVRSVIAGLPAARGLGFLAWEPAWLPGPSWGQDVEAMYRNLTMFDGSGVGLPSLAAFQPDPP